MKPEFEKLLGDDKDKFIENIKNSISWDENDSLEVGLKELSNQPDFRSFVASAFIWSDTEEGLDFWANVASRK